MERVIEFKGANNTLLVAAVLEQYLQIDTLNIEVTADKARTIILPEYSKLININLKINVIDKTGTAKTNNITIQTQNPDLINGASSVLINTDFGYAQVTGATLNKTQQYACLFGGQSSSSAAGGGGGGGLNFQTFDVVIPSARVLQLLNDVNDFQEIIPNLGLNNVIQLISISYTQVSQYNGTAPQLYFGTALYPDNALYLTPSGWLADAAKNSIVTQCIQYPVASATPNRTTFGGANFGVGAVTNAGSNAGGDIRVFGIYLVKSLV